MRRPPQAVRFDSASRFRPQVSFRNAPAIISAGVFHCWPKSEVLLSGLPCPQCGGRTHRSHANRFRERLIRSWTSYKAYRCRECGWRGWLRNRKSSSKRPTLRTIIGLVVTLLITTLLALYLIEKLNAPAPGSDYQQQVP